MSPTAREQESGMVRASRDDSRLRLDATPRRYHQSAGDSPLGRQTDSWINVPARSATSSISHSQYGAVIDADGHHNNARGFVRSTSQCSQYRTTRAPNTDFSSSAESSSQEEYEESESESDRVLSPSEVRNQQQPQSHADVLLTESCFTPQPNAFSHPPSSIARQSENPRDSYFPTAAYRDDFDEGHVPQNSSCQFHRQASNNADHDAALRASLTTLLSCAAAARSLPKTSGAVNQRARGSTRIQPGSLRMICDRPPTQDSCRAETRSLQEAQIEPCIEGHIGLNSNAAPLSADLANKKSKHKSVATHSSSKERNAVRRLIATGIDEMISPTLFTWLVSAGVLVVVSAISFTAGYSAGHEAGWVESSAGWPHGEQAVPDYGRHNSRTGLGLKKRIWNRVVASTA